MKEWVININLTYRERMENEDVGRYHAVVVGEEDAVRSGLAQVALVAALSPEACDPAPHRRWAARCHYIADIMREVMEETERAGLMDKELYIAWRGVKAGNRWDRRDDAAGR